MLRVLISITAFLFFYSLLILVGMVMDVNCRVDDVAFQPDMKWEEERWTEAELEQIRDADRLLAKRTSQRFRSVLLLIAVR